MTHQIYIPSDLKPAPYSHEMFAAQSVSVFFNADIAFIKRSSSAKTADLIIKNTIWEVKSPTGDGKRTMQNNLRLADDQSPNVIINLARCKMAPNKAMSRIRYELKRASKIKQLLIVLKSGKVIKLK